MTSLTPDPDDPVWRTIAIAARWESARRESESAQQLGRADGRLLWLFTDGRARTLRQIADELSLEQSTVNRQVNAALRAGLLRRFRSPGCSAQLLEATEKGHTQFEDDLRRYLDLHERALAAVPRTQRATFLTHLEAFVAAYTDAAQADAQAS